MGSQCSISFDDAAVAVVPTATTNTGAAVVHPTQSPLAEQSPIERHQVAEQALHTVPISERARVHHGCRSPLPAGADTTPNVHHQPTMPLSRQDPQQRKKPNRKMRPPMDGSSFKSIHIPPSTLVAVTSRPPIEASLWSLEGDGAPFCPVGLPEILRLPPEAGTAAPLRTPSNRGSGGSRVSFTHRRTSATANVNVHSHQRCTSSNWSLFSDVSPKGSGSHSGGSGSGSQRGTLRLQQHRSPPSSTSSQRLRHAQGEVVVPAATTPTTLHSTTPLDADAAPMQPAAVSPFPFVLHGTA